MLAFAALAAAALPVAARTPAKTPAVGASAVLRGRSTAPTLASVPATLHWAPAEFDDARCIDGSRYGVYVALANDSATGRPSTKWMIYHQGGGWCQTLAECATRANSSLGTSKNLAQVVDVQSVERSDFTSRDPRINPALHDFNFVYMPYLDGGSFTGDSSVPYPACTVCDGTMHFRGMRNREAVVAVITKMGFDKATEIVVSGCSAGGAAAFIHTDWWGEQVPSARTVGMPQSGWFYEGHYNRDGKDDYQAKMANLFKFMNSSRGLTSASGKACVAAGRGSSCLFAHSVMDFVKSPIFSLNSKYDATMGLGEYPLINGTPAHFDWADPALVNEEGVDITERFRRSFVPPHGAFLDACHHHCGTWAGMEFSLDGAPPGAPKRNATAAFAEWYRSMAKGAGQPAFYNEDKAYPCDACCVQ